MNLAITPCCLGGTALSWAGWRESGGRTGISPGGALRILGSRAPIASHHTDSVGDRALKERALPNRRGAGEKTCTGRDPANLSSSQRRGFLRERLEGALTPALMSSGLLLNGSHGSDVSQSFQGPSPCGHSFHTHTCVAPSPLRPRVSPPPCLQHCHPWARSWVSKMLYK